MRPRLLDLFCGAGGCTKGYQDAGFYVVGVDINPQPNYCGDEFIQDDALAVLERVAAGAAVEGVRHNVLSDAIHASPPCQDYSKALRHMASPQPRLIEPVRELLEQTGLPWVIENVAGAPMPEQHTLDGRFGAMFCGTAFGKRIYRHRLFEANWPIHAAPCAHRQPALNPHNKRSRELHTGGRWIEAEWRTEMGVDWMDKAAAREAVPPYFTEHIGRQLLAHIQQKAAA